MPTPPIPESRRSKTHLSCLAVLFVAPLLLLASEPSLRRQLSPERGLISQGQGQPSAPEPLLPVVAPAPELSAPSVESAGGQLLSAAPVFEEAAGESTLLAQNSGPEIQRPETASSPAPLSGGDAGEPAALAQTRTAYPRLEPLDIPQGSQPFMLKYKTVEKAAVVEQPCNCRRVAGYNGPTVGYNGQTVNYAGKTVGYSGQTVGYGPVVGYTGKTVNYNLALQGVWLGANAGGSVGGSGISGGSPIQWGKDSAPGCVR